DKRTVEVPPADFDFDASNKKFNKQDLVKEAIASGSPLGTPSEEPVTSPTANEGGAVNGAAKDADEEEDVLIPKVTTYNKSSSFFDNISSELKDREDAAGTGKRLGGQEFRTEERKKNLETFGLGSVDSGFGGRGGFRGRGRGRGRGYGAGRGHGPRGGLRGRGGALGAESSGA
ncbi:hypothetical protein LTR16_007103, partial [Cryomyces antarcticus]